MFLFPGNLLILARQKVASDGYLFAKGKSRSCSSQSESDDSSKAKRQKTDADQRAREITLLKENLSTLESRLKYKQQMIDKARSVSNYKQCDEISADIINVRKEKRNVERQLASIEKKQAKSEWYHSKKHKKSRNKKLEAKGGNLHQQGESSSSVLHHFLTENNKTKRRKIHVSNAKITTNRYPSIVIVSSLAFDALSSLMKIFSYSLPIGRRISRTN